MNLPTVWREYAIWRVGNRWVAAPAADRDEAWAEGNTPLEALAKLLEGDIVLVLIAARDGSVQPLEALKMIDELMATPGRGSVFSEEVT